MCRNHEGVNLPVSMKKPNHEENGNKRKKKFLTLTNVTWFFTCPIFIFKVKTTFDYEILTRKFHENQKSVVESYQNGFQIAFLGVLIWTLTVQFWNVG